MTNSEKKAWLGQYRANEREIDRLTEEIQRWGSLATKMGTGFSSVPRSARQGDRVQISVEKITELQAEICDKVDKRVALRREIEQAIAAVKDGVLRLLLAYRYIDGLTWEQVAVEMRYDYSHVAFCLHNKALSGIKVPIVSN